jgi:hypothetical protein
MKSKRTQHKKKFRTTKRGGWGFNRKVMPGAVCDPNQLPMIQGSSALHQKYQECCPKSFLGLKNSSPYCKQIDLNFKAALNQENGTGYSGFSPEEAYNMQNTAGNQPYAQLSNRDMQLTMAQTKPWYKIWGGKKTKKRVRRHKK